MPATNVVSVADATKTFLKTFNSGLIAEAVTHSSPDSMSVSINRFLKCWLTNK